MESVKLRYSSQKIFVWTKFYMLFCLSFAESCDYWFCFLFLIKLHNLIIDFLSIVLLYPLTGWPAGTAEGGQLDGTCWISCYCRGLPVVWVTLQLAVLIDMGFFLLYLTLIFLSNLYLSFTPQINSHKIHKLSMQRACKLVLKDENAWIKLCFK